VRAELRPEPDLDKLARALQLLVEQTISTEPVDSAVLADDVASPRDSDRFIERVGLLWLILGALICRNGRLQCRWRVTFC
jgi:hypothetical protein